ncbi:MAG: GxxExxY protein [Anaerolineales bacterium]|uniref:GxxExxY protein n=1 Tax=Candidatus Villigracilis proximus TaxID=3140683 RepID=UPI00313673DA|nr:GxxExxY protein [Anaerolineales bacterium]
MADLLFKDEVYSIIGAAMDVYNDLGPGFLENVYQEPMEMEAEERKIPFKAQHQIIVKYKGKPLKKFYIADLMCYEKIIVEIKAANGLTLREEGQLLNYLKATGIQVGVLINFGRYPSLEWKRLVLTKGNSSTL